MIVVSPLMRYVSRLAVSFIILSIVALSPPGMLLKNLSRRKNTFSAGQIGLCLRGRIGRVSPKDVIGAATFTRDRSHDLAAPSIPFLKRSIFDGHIVLLLDEGRVLPDDLIIKTRKGDDMSSRLAGFFSQPFHPQHAHHFSATRAIHDLTTAQLILNALSHHIDEPASFGLNHFLGNW